MKGAFGSNESRNFETPIQPPKTKHNYRNKKLDSRFSNKKRPISPERWVDVVCISLLGLFGIIIAFNWTTLSDALFYNILFPVIAVGARIVVVVMGMGALIGFIVTKIRRRRRWF